jgi:hypothetical protein
MSVWPSPSPVTLLWKNHAKPSISCMRCLQSNLAFLAQLGPNKPITAPTPKGPALMEPPPGVPQDIKDGYERLKPLFPGWNGVPKASPRQANAPLPPGGQTQAAANPVLAS